ncbi:MAG: hypothetical protein U5N53_00445 [Mycobacterium sp.]|nr:hypothetical protein [Mycobacterium sp.]
MSISETMSLSPSATTSESVSTTETVSESASGSATVSESVVETTTYHASFINKARPYVTKDNQTIIDTPYPTSVLTIMGLGFHKIARQNVVEFQRLEPHRKPAVHAPVQPHLPRPAQ